MDAHAYLNLRCSHLHKGLFPYCASTISRFIVMQAASAEYPCYKIRSVIVTNIKALYPTILLESGESVPHKTACAPSKDLDQIVRSHSRPVDVINPEPTYLAELLQDNGLGRRYLSLFE